MPILSPDQARPWGAVSIKTLNTRDGQAYTYTLTHEGTPVAAVENTGTGGSTQIRWHGLRWDGAPLSAETLIHHPVAHRKAVPVATRAHAAWKTLLESLPSVPSEYGPDLSVDDSWLAEDLLNIANIRKQKKILFTLPDGREYALSGPINEQARAWVKRKHPDAVILNDLWANVPTPPPAAHQAVRPQAAHVPTLEEMLAKVAIAKARNS